MTMNFNSSGQRVDLGWDETQDTKAVALEFQPVIVTGGQFVTNLPPEPATAVKITIDPEKLKK